MTNPELLQIESERLVYRQWRASDIEPYSAFFANPEQAKYVGGHCDRNQAWRKLTSCVGHWQLRGYGFWAIEEKSTGHFAGCVGPWLPEGWPELEVGYWIMPEMQGKGYATEAVVRSRQAAYQHLGAATLVSYIHPDNHASKRVAQRAGASYEKTIELCTFGAHEVFRHPSPDTAAPPLP